MILRDSRGGIHDLGPLRGRIAGQRGYAGSLATYTAPPHDHNANRTGDPNGARTRRNGLRGEHMLRRPRPRNKYDDVPRCGVVLTLVGEPCHRLPGHRSSHRSKVVMDLENARRSGHGMVR